MTRQVNKHEVALVVLESKNYDGTTHRQYELLCGCSFDGNDVYKCKARKKIANRFAEQLRANDCVNLTTKGAIALVFDLVQRGYYVGQFNGGVIYYQEVSTILQKDEQEVLECLKELFKEEKIDLNGAILIPYEKHFRFPQEVRSLLRYIIEEPLGWPNGEAGDIFLYTIEKAISENTDYKRGKKTFGERYFPHLPPHILRMFGKGWQNLALKNENKSR